MIIENKLSPAIIKHYTKAAIDIEKERIAVDCEFHIDCAEELITSGSNPKDVWGFNISPDGSLDYEAVYNIRPSANNRTMIIQDQNIKERIRKIFEKNWQI